jgi:hypothetical protein
MEKIRNLVVLFGLSLTLVALGATGARAQGFTMTGVGGAFTLSHEARWGTVTLPAGSYTLQYGYAGSGLPVVEVHGTANGGPHVIIAAQGQNQTSGTKNAIVCVREGSRLVVRELEMAAISESASFALPRGAQLTAKQSNGKKNIQLAEGPMLIQRIPIKLNSK